MMPVRKNVIYVSGLRSRVARLFLVHDTQTGKMYQMFQIVIEDPKSPWNITDGRKIYKHFPI
jgi:hypothetical protein